jgi:hypothetical protein
MEVSHERGVRTPLSVTGLGRGHGETLLHHGEVQIEQYGPMEQKVLLQSSLSVAGTFTVPDSQIALSPGFNGLTEQSLQREALPLKHNRRCPRNGGERTVTRDRKHKGVVEAARTLQDGPAAAVSPQNRDVPGATRFQVYFRSDTVGIPKHHEVAPRLPEPEESPPRSLLLAHLQQGMITGQILLRGREAQVEKFH